MQFTKDHPEVYDYLPDGYEIDMVGKVFLCNICATLLEEEVLAEWAKQLIKEMNIDVTMKDDA